MSKSHKNIFQEGIDNYSINLLWINNKKDVNQKYIHSAKSEEELVAQFLTPAIKWAKANPIKSGAEINIWYDAKIHDVQAVLNTQTTLEELVSREGCNNIKLKDIRDISIVNQNSFLFSENMPLYFRIDLLKMIICLHSLKNEGKDAAIFSDLEVGELRSDAGRMDKAELFDQASMSKLEKFGIITNKGPLGYLENQFLQLVNNETTILALKHSINACLMRGKDTLNMPLFLQEKIMPKIHEAPYYSATHEISKWYMGTKADTIEVRTEFLKEVLKIDLTEAELKEQKIKYDPKTHGYEPLGNCIHLGAKSCFYLDIKKPDPFFQDKKILCDKEICLTSTGVLVLYKYGHRILTFGYDITDEDCVSTRTIDSRDGNKHTEKFIPLEADHAPFVCKYWEEASPIDLVGEYQNTDYIAN